MHVWAGCGDPAVDLQHSLMEAVPGHTHASAGWECALSSCRASGRIQVPYLHLSHTITAEKATTAFTSMHMTSRIAGSLNPASLITTIATVALENRRILDRTGSALCYMIESDRSVCNHVTAEEDDANSGERRMGIAILG